MGGDESERVGRTAESCDDVRDMNRNPNPTCGGVKADLCVWADVVKKCDRNDAGNDTALREEAGTLLVR